MTRKPLQSASEWEGSWPAGAGVRTCVHACVHDWGAAMSCPVPELAGPANRATVPGAKQMEPDGQRDALPLLCPAAAPWQHVLAGTGCWQELAAGR